MGSPPATSSSSAQKLALLATLYFSQGLPFGFFTQALPVWMRQSGMDLTLIGLSSLLALPWGLKFLWAPLVDRHGHPRLGRRRGWILPLQLSAAALIVVLGLFDFDGNSARGLILLLASGMFLTNLLAATQDIATDGLAVDLLSSRERGLGNGVQVAAYRVGMIVGGGALLMVLGRLGFSFSFYLMAGLLLIMTVPIALFREPPPAARSSTEPADPVSLAAALHFLRRNGGKMFVWVLAIGFYKFGDGFGSAMVKPFLVDAGWSVAQIGAVVGTGGSVAGMVGALLGGALARKGRLLALVVCGLVHAALMASYAFATGSAGPGDAAVDVVAGLLILEHLTGGMATVSLFTAMMDACEPRTGATDYTVQASVVVFASGAGAALSGFVAARYGYSAHFVTAAVACFAGTLVMVPLYRFGIAPRDPSFDDDLHTPVAHAATGSSSTSTAVTATAPKAGP